MSTGTRTSRTPTGAHRLPGEPTATALKLWVVLTRAYHAVAARAEADIARYGLTPGEFAVLDALYHKGPLLLGSLQRKMLISSGGTTFLVDRLAAKGLVERRACPTDRRARYAALTPKGEAQFGQMFREHGACIARAVAGLNRKEQAEAVRLLRTLGLAAAET